MSIAAKDHKNDFKKPNYFFTMHFQLSVSNGPLTGECSTELAEHKSSLGIGSTTPISVSLPLPYPRAESALLSAWAVLLKGYYTNQTLSFLQFTNTNTDGSSRESFKSESISIDLDSGWSAMDLERNLVQCRYSLPPSGESPGVESNPYVVFFVKQEDNVSADGCERKICNLVSASQVSYT